MQQPHGLQVYRRTKSVLEWNLSTPPALHASARPIKIFCTSLVPS